MKKLNTLSTIGAVLILTTGLFLINCTKKADGTVTPSVTNGTNGVKGDKGDKGDTGATGATGAKGDKGDTGSTGAAGATGATGAKGDKGDTGATGATGPKGDKGDTGNANVIQVTFAATFVPDVVGRLFTFPAAITTTMLNTSSVNVYVQASNYPGTWYPIPGFISGNLDNFRTYIDAPPRQVSVIRQSGTTVASITSTRVVIIPANNLINGRDRKSVV